MEDLKFYLQKVEEIKNEYDEEEIRNFIYKTNYKRLLLSLEILQKIEEKLLETLNEEEVSIKDLVSIQKSLVKSLDMTKSMLRQFEPALKEIKLEEASEYFDIQSGDNLKEAIKKVVSKQVIHLIQLAYDIQTSLEKYKQGSINSWKAQESLKSLTTVLEGLTKVLDKFGEEALEENEFSVSEMLKLYKTMKEAINE